MNSNRDNPRVGREFEALTAKVLGRHFGVEFELGVAIPIGYPAKDHKFDCVSVDERIVAECKCFTWTNTGNVPSAKMGFVNQAVFYLSFLPDGIKRVIVMKKATHRKRTETLAEYYCRTYIHLLQGVSLLELDAENEVIITIKE